MEKYFALRMTEPLAAGEFYDALHEIGIREKQTAFQIFL